MMANLYRIVLFMVIVIAGFSTGICIGESGNGPEQITLNGGRTGNVLFPHRSHQSALADCTVCHDLFPQKIGAIDALKGRGELKPKQIMTGHCIKCHREMAKAGKKAGPTSCRVCHVKG